MVQIVLRHQHPWPQQVDPLPVNLPIWAAASHPIITDTQDPTLSMTLAATTHPQELVLLDPLGLPTATITILEVLKEYPHRQLGRETAEAAVVV